MHPCAQAPDVPHGLWRNAEGCAESRRQLILLVPVRVVPGLKNQGRSLSRDGANAPRRIRRTTHIALRWTWIRTARHAGHHVVPFKALELVLFYLDFDAYAKKQFFTKVNNFFYARQHLLRSGPSFRCHLAFVDS